MGKMKDRTLDPIWIDRHRAEIMLEDMIRGRAESVYLEMAIVSMKTELEFSDEEMAKKETDEGIPF